MVITGQKNHCTTKTTKMGTRHFMTIGEIQQELNNLKTKQVYLTEEYKRLHPIQKGDYVRVTTSSQRVFVAGCVGHELTPDFFNIPIQPILHKLKKDGEISKVGRMFIDVDHCKIEKISKEDANNWNN